MVRLSKIYTKTGDDGSTALGSGERVPKHGVRVEAYGTVDEANAAIGLARTALAHSDEHRAMDEALMLAQNELFDVGADLCVPREHDEGEGARLRVTDDQIERIEATIDRFNSKLEPLNSFVLPGGSEAAARLHLARTEVRRAERRVGALMDVEPDRVNPRVMVYLNRLSDLLFVLGRIANDQGKRDVLWVPGAKREGDEG